MAQIHASSSTLGRSSRPRLIRTANRVGEVLLRAGVGGRPWRADALMDAASQAEGLHDFGDGAFLEPLSRLLDSIDREARLHPVGRLITKGRIVAALRTRLRAEALIARHPEILSMPIEAPIVIAGLQRTGTTMLHRLLAQDPGLRALASWEALEPVAAIDARNPDGARVRNARIAEQGLRYMAPEFFAIHPTEALAPEEEVMLLDLSFLSTVPEATLHVPSFARWLEEQDQRPAYEYLRRMLQVLSWQRGGAKRWVLKTPHHLEWLDSLLEVFPDARIVATHRDPLRTIASFSSMIAHGRAIFSDEVDPHEVAAHWSKKIYRMVDRAMATRDRLGDAASAQFIDVSYYDLMKAPMPQLERIYAFADRPLSAQTRARIEASRKVNEQNKYGRHAYRLEDFGLSAASVEPHIARYRARYAIPIE